MKNTDPAGQVPHDDGARRIVTPQQAGQLAARAILDDPFAFSEGLHSELVEQGTNWRHVLPDVLGRPARRRGGQGT